MDTGEKHFIEKKEKAKKLYDVQKGVHNPYLDKEITFNSDGFHHLQFSDRRERNKEEQLLKFNLLPLAIKIIKNSGTLQEYREKRLSIGKKSKDGLRKTKMVCFWGFSSIVGKPESKIKVRVILRKVGDGKYTFWSVMPDSKLRGGQKLYTSGIEED